MAKGFYQYYKDLPSWAKGVVVVGSGVVAYMAVTSIMRKINQAKETAKSMQEVDSANSELQTEIKSGKKPTITNTIAEAISNAIVSASNDCGTDEKLIFSQFDKVNNQADMLLLVQIFGLRKKIRCVFSDDPRESFMSAYTPPMSLSAMLNSELDTTQLQTLNNKLATKGIKYKF
jgi:hypothetical protein